ncbi:MAG: hypothetical protein JWL88_96 [Parcubacteria group bacterium]|nr:hypothetical protein [Parcubacteria group bacterium]
METKKYEVVVAESSSEDTGLECRNCGKKLLLDGLYMVGMKTKNFFYVIVEDEPSTCCSARPEQIKGFETKELAQRYAAEFDEELTRTNELSRHMMKLTKDIITLQRTGLQS